MPLFGKSKEKHDFYLLVHQLAPFPAHIKSLYIAWQRGSTKEGRTRSVAPVPEGPGRSWATFQFEESFHVDCALSQVFFESQSGNNRLSAQENLPLIKILGKAASFTPVPKDLC